MASNQLIVAPGASHSVKALPIDLILEILDNFPDEIRPEIVLLGAESDQDLCKSLAISLQLKFEVKNLCGQTSLPDLRDILLNSRALLAADSAISHLAKFLEIPVAVLLGPTVESFGFSLTEGSKKAFSAELACRPCSRHGKIPCRYGDKLCFQEINYREVATWLASHFPAE